MKRECIFINASRGKCVHTEAVFDALRSGSIDAAALDVIDPEPVPSAHSLLQLPFSSRAAYCGDYPRDGRDSTPNCGRRNHSNAEWFSTEKIVEPSCPCYAPSSAASVIAFNLSAMNTRRVS